MIPVDNQEHEVYARLNHVKATEYTQKGTPFQKCKIDGFSQDITIWQGNGEPIPPSAQGRTWWFKLKASVRGKYTNVGGFWLPNKQAEPPQTPQNEPQSTNAGLPDSKPDWDKKDLRIIAQCFGKIFAEYEAKGAMTPDSAKHKAKEWVIWAWNINTNPPDWNKGMPEEQCEYGPDDSEIPF